MPPDPTDDRHRPMCQGRSNVCVCGLLNADDSAHIPDELDEWRATYGRLDLPVTLFDWRPIAAGIAALGIALAARWIVRHGR